MQEFRLALSCSVLVLLAHSVSTAQSVRQLAQKTFPSVVLFIMQDASGQPLSLGSGFFVGDGIIATNLHVVRGASAGQVKLVGQTKTYVVNGLVGVDANADLVLLRMPGTDAPALQLSDGSDVAVGDPVYALGNPEGLEGTFSQGIVSGLRGSGSDRLLQITAPISPGSSGGPIIDSRGKVIGVAAATFSEGQNLNFAIPSSYLVSLLKRAGDARPLSAVKEVQEDAKPFARILGENRTEGVIGTDCHWWDRSVSFGILNRTGSPVKDIRFLVVFFDKKSGGHPIDYIESATCPNVVILPNLPKLQTEFLVSPNSSYSGSYCGKLLVEQRTGYKHTELRFGCWISSSRNSSGLGGSCSLQPPGRCLNCNLRAAVSSMSCNSHVWHSYLPTLFFRYRA